MSATDTRDAIDALLDAMPEGELDITLDALTRLTESPSGFLGYLESGTPLGLSGSVGDRFDFYLVDEPLCAQSPLWETWDGAATDVNVVDTDAYSPEKSLYFASTDPTGGPQNVLLCFGSLFKSGLVSCSMWMKVESGKGAAINIQANPTRGERALAVQLRQDGEILLRNDKGLNLSEASAFPFDVWFKLEVKADLQQNQWQLMVNNVEKLAFTNSINRMTWLNIAPYNGAGHGGNNLCGYWVDDVQFWFNLPPGATIGGLD